MGEDKYHFVEFGEYCKNCKYFGRPIGVGEPCDDCLMERARLNTTKPLNYMSKTSDEKKQNRAG